MEVRRRAIWLPLCGLFVACGLSLLSCADGTAPVVNRTHPVGSLRWWSVPADSSARPDSTVEVAIQVNAPDGSVSPGTTVEWHVGAHSGTLATATSVSNDSGIARVRWTLDSMPTRQSITASAGDSSLTATLLVGESSPEITVAIQLPDASGPDVFGDSMLVSLAVHSDFLLSRVVVSTVGADSALMLPALQGYLSLTHVGPWDQVLRVSATDTVGHRTVIYQWYRHIPVPVLTVRAPADGRYATGGVPVDATCALKPAAADVACDLYVRFHTLDSPNLSTAQSQLTAAVPFDTLATPGDQLAVYVLGEFRTAPPAIDTSVVTVGAMAPFDSVAIVPGEVLDALEGRVLWAADTGVHRPAYVRTLSTGVDSLVGTDLAPLIDPHGGTALAPRLTTTGVASGNLVWHAGTATPFHSIAVAGDWVVGGSRPYTLRNVSSGAETQLPDGAVGVEGVTATGSVVYTRAGGVYLFANGSETRLADADSAMALPVTDGLSAIYVRSDTLRVRPLSGSTEVVLGPFFDKIVADSGWVGYTRAVSYVPRLRAPGGTETDLAPIQGFIEAVASDGAAVVRPYSSTRRYFVPPGGSATLIARHGRVVARDGKLVLLNGHGVFLLDGQ